MSITTDHALPSLQRAEAYWFLASLFGGPISSEALARLAVVNDGVPSEEQGMAAALHDALAGESDWNAFAERLAPEHARLFLGLREGHGPLPPYESLWREGRVAGESALSVAKAYSEAGFDDEGPWGPCDHLTYELRFMASLCHAEHEADRAAAIDEADWARERQARFLEEHLRVWVGDYCEHIAKHAQESLYQALARVTARMVVEDARQLRTRHPGLGADPIPAAGAGSASGLDQ
jgi:TorA maturation chaperone TorD